MHKLYSIVILVVALAALSPNGAPAQTGAGKAAPNLKVGKVDLDFQNGNFTPALWHLTGRVKMTSDDYDLAGEDIKVYFASKKSGRNGTPSLAKATVDGSLSAGTQVSAHIRQPLQSQAYEVLADHAVYVPEPERKDGGRMDFTGHVRVITHSGFLAEPSVTTTDHATVLMGQGEDYPSVSTGPAHITLTPAQ